MSIHGSATNLDELSLEKAEFMSNYEIRWCTTCGMDRYVDFEGHSVEGSTRALESSLVDGCTCPHDGVNVEKNKGKSN
jgi:hypothetical protein